MGLGEGVVHLLEGSEGAGASLLEESLGFLQGVPGALEDLGDFPLQPGEGFPAFPEGLPCLLSCLLQGLESVWQGLGEGVAHAGEIAEGGFQVVQGFLGASLFHEGGQLLEEFLEGFQGVFQFLAVDFLADGVQGGEA